MTQLPVTSLPKDRSITFVLHDAGETRALTPLMRQLEAQGRNYHILADGTATKIVQQTPALANHQVYLPKDIATLNPSLATLQAQRLAEALNAATIVTGLVSPFQQQWANYAHHTGKRVLGYWDAYGVNEATSVSPFNGCLDGLMTPSQSTAISLQSQLPSTPVLAVGQPTLDDVESTANSPLARQQNQQLADALRLDTHRPIILFIGGYGNEYEESVRLFCQSVQQLPSTHQVVLALHPKADGLIEQRIIDQMGLQSRVLITPKSIATEVLLPLASVVATQGSSLAIPAMALGKPVVLVGAETMANNPLTKHHLALRSNTPNQLTQALLTSRPLTNTVHQQLGIPTNATATMLNLLG
jgi:hypothetical protein